MLKGKLFSKSAYTFIKIVRSRVAALRRYTWLELHFCPSVSQANRSVNPLWQQKDRVLFG